MGNEIARIEPASMAELRAFASDAGKTGFYGAKSPEQALLIAMTGRDLGLSYAQSLRAFHVIEGKPTMTSDGMVAAILASGKAEYFTTIDTTTTSCTVATKRKGSPVASQMTFTMEDAKRAGLAGKAMWGKYPREMLRARAKAMLARDVYPDVLFGLYTADEISDGVVVPEMGPIDVTPSPVPAAPTPAPAPSGPTVAERYATALADLEMVPADVDAWRESRGEPPALSLTTEGIRALVAGLRNGLGDEFRAWLAARPAEGGGQ